MSHVPNVKSSVTRVQAPKSVSACQWRTFGPAEVDEALVRWRRLEQRLQGNSIACSFTWTDCWIRHYGDLVPYRVLLAEAGGVDQGIALMTEGRDQKLGSVPVQTRHFGTAGEPLIGSVCVEYNRFLVEPNWESDFRQGLFTALERENDWEQLRLDGFDEQETACWTEHFPHSEVRSRDCHYFDFQQAREQGTDVISLLGKSTRSNLRRRLRQYGELQLEWAETVSQADSILRELIELHQARWQAVGEPGAFANPRFLAFQEQSAIRLFLEQRAVLFRVRQGNETVGCLYLLVDNNRLLDYLSGFVSFDVKPSPGLISHYLCMEEALRRGFIAYDFLVGEKRHKDNLSTHSQQLSWLTWSRPTWKMRSLRTLRSLKRGISGWKANCLSRGTDDSHTNRGACRNSTESES